MEGQKSQITNDLSVPVGIQLSEIVCGEYSGRRTILNWRMSLPLLQPIPISSITYPQKKVRLPGSQVVCSEIPAEAESS